MHVAAFVAPIVAAVSAAAVLLPPSPPLHRAHATASAAALQIAARTRVQPQSVRLHLPAATVACTGRHSTDGSASTRPAAASPEAEQSAEQVRETVRSRPTRASCSLCSAPLCVRRLLTAICCCNRSISRASSNCGGCDSGMAAASAAVLSGHTSAAICVSLLCVGNVPAVYERGGAEVSVGVIAAIAARLSSRERGLQRSVRQLHRLTRTPAHYTLRTTHYDLTFSTHSAVSCGDRVQIAGEKSGRRPTALSRWPPSPFHGSHCFLRLSSRFRRSAALLRCCLAAAHRRHSFFHLHCCRRHADRQRATRSALPAHRKDVQSVERLLLCRIPPLLPSLSSELRSPPVAHPRFVCTLLLL